MPRCEGLPGSGCPKRTNNRTVKLSQGDLMLCPACEAVRFPVESECSAKVSKPTIASVSQNIATKLIEGAVQQESRDRKIQQRPSGNSKLQLSSTSEEFCSVCYETVDGSRIRCDLCKEKYHHECSGLPKDVFEILLSIVAEAGWVCLQCRNGVNNRVQTLQVTLAKTVEELADVRLSLGHLIEEVSELKKVSCAETPAIVETMASNTVVSKKDPVGQAISLEVNKQLSAIRKRK